MELTFTNDGETIHDIYENIYHELMIKTFAHLHIVQNYIIEVNLIDNEKIHQINRNYRHIDRPTDVISFAFLDEVAGEVAIKGNIPILLGEIFISIEKALEQSKNFGHSMEREMSFLFIHGLLHLLGYDHQNEDDEKEMFSLQEEILTKEK